LALDSTFQEETSKIYAFFLEEVTEIFLATRPMDTNLIESWLLDWQDLLSRLQKDWEVQREPLLTALQQHDQANFERIFHTFTHTWLTHTYAKFPTAQASTRHEAIQALSAKIFTSAMHQVVFFQPKRRELKKQYGYDPSDDGQARIYEQWFTKTRATLSGKRRWFADYHAWREGRGALFPDLMATLNGERPLFVELLLAIKKLLLAINAFFFQTPDQGEPELRMCLVGG